MTSISFILIIAILGTFIGSFTNVVIFRLHGGEKGILTGRSFCPHCKKTIKPYDLIPIVSFLLLRGKCRFCAHAISWKYPAVESLTGAVFGVTAFGFLWNNLSLWMLPLWLFYVFLLVAISVYDLYYLEIPDILIFLGIGVAAVVAILVSVLQLPGVAIPDALAGAALGGAFFGLQVWISHETWMGMGDVFIGIFMGLVLGLAKTIVAIFVFAYPIGAIISIGLLAGAKKKMNSQVPFGPFLAIGMLLAMVLGNEVIRWYGMFLS